MADRGETVTVTFPPPGIGGELSFEARVTKANPDGTIDCLVFVPDGDADVFLTGARSKAAWLEIPEGDAARNLAYFEAS